MLKELKKVLVSRIHSAIKIMFTSVLSTLKTQSEKLKETINTNVAQFRNSEQVQELSFSKLRSNVLEKSGWIQTSVAQRLTPYLLNNNPNPNQSSSSNYKPLLLDNDNKKHKCLEIDKSSNYNKTYSKSQFSSQRSLSSYFRPKVHINPSSGSQEFGSDAERPSNSSKSRRRSAKSTQTLRNSRTANCKPPQNVNKTWIEMDLKNNCGRKLGSNHGGHSSSSSSESEEEEDITEKFSRVTGLLQAALSNGDVMHKSLQFKI